MSKNCTKTAPKLHQNYTKTAPKLHQNCTKTAPKLHQNCTKTAPFLETRFFVSIYISACYMFCPIFSVSFLFAVFPKPNKLSLILHYISVVIKS
jgi:hypothetical protein